MSAFVFWTDKLGEVGGAASLVDANSLVAFCPQERRRESRVRCDL